MVLGDARGLVVLDALTAAQRRQDALLLIEKLRRDDDRDGSADCLLGRVAEEALRACVPGADDAVERLADDGIVRVLDDGSHVPQRTLNLPVASEAQLQGKRLALQLGHRRLLYSGGGRRTVLCRNDVRMRGTDLLQRPVTAIRRKVGMGVRAEQREGV